jgi:hypothetical protein
VTEAGVVVLPFVTGAVVDVVVEPTRVTLSTFSEPLSSNATVRVSACGVKVTSTVACN